MKMPISRALTLIFLSVMAISGPATLALLYYQKLHRQHLNDPRYLIRSLALLCTDSHPLPTDEICAVLGLSIDHPTNLYALKTSGAKKKLLTHPAIKQAAMAKMLPDTLWIEYHLRQPIAQIGDYQNVTVDTHGFPLPHRGEPLPTFILGVTQIAWNTPLRAPQFGYAKKLYQLMQAHFQEMILHRIDVSKIFSPSWGKREIIIIVEEPQTNHQITLRLGVTDYRQGLANFKTLREQLPDTGDRIIDLRIPQIALITAS